MKKKAIIFLTAALLFSMTACGNKKDDNKGETLPSGDTTENDSTYEESSTDYGAGVDIQDIKKALTDEFGDNYWPDTEISKEMLKDIYGVSEDLYEEYYGESPMISTNVDTVLVVKAKEDQVAAVEEALNEYRSKLVNDTMQYPMNIGKIQASRIETFGSYVCFVQLGADTMEASENGDEAVIEKCQQDNELALEIIQNTLAKNQ